MHLVNAVGEMVLNGTFMDVLLAPLRRSSRHRGFTMTPGPAATETRHHRKCLTQASGSGRTWLAAVLVAYFLLPAKMPLKVPEKMNTEKHLVTLAGVA